MFKKTVAILIFYPANTFFIIMPVFTSNFMNSFSKIIDKI